MNSRRRTPSSLPNPTCASDSQLQVAAVLGQPVGFGTSGRRHGGHGSGWSFPRNLDGGPQQINLLAVHVLHVVLPDDKGLAVSLCESGIATIVLY